MNARKLLSAAKAVEAAYIEDVFSTYLYTGSNSAQTITTGIDLPTYGGMLWLKGRNVGSAYSYGDHEIFDTANVGSTRKWLRSDGTDPLGTNGSIATTPFTTSGFNLTAGPQINNRSGDTNVSWTFRKQAKFFDVVTYTGDGTSSRQVSHSLGSIPGCIIIKATNNTSGWYVLHRGDGSWVQGLNLQDTRVGSAGIGGGYGAAPTASIFTLAASVGGGDTNQNGWTYVAYLFAHDAGGFGASGADNVISCGSFTTDGSGNATVTLGYEPQWILRKTTAIADNWYLQDTMRGMAYSGFSYLSANLSNAEASLSGDYIVPNSTGFTVKAFNASTTYIYIAIRRGPMKTPTTGTSVYVPIAKTGDGSTTTVTNVGFPADMFMFKWRALAYGWKQQDRLRGFPQALASDQTGAESNSGTYTFGTVNNTGYTYGSDASINSGELNFSGVTSSVLAFRRAPGFFDEVCYTGTGVARTVTHNLGVTPELMIVKSRSNGLAWRTYANAIGNNNYLILNSTQASAASSNEWNDTTPTNTVFTVGTSSNTNLNTGTFVAYLFATCPGVSKVGSYTGTGNTLQIDCGFTGGARFVLIKRTDSTGDWYVWDSARGIVAGNDPYLLLNSTAAEVTSTDYVDTYSAGFEISSTAPAAINANGGTFVFLAIA